MTAQTKLPRKPKLGQIIEIPEMGNSINGQVIAQLVRDKKTGKVIDRLAWRDFHFTDKKTDETKSAINIIISSVHGTVEVTLFGEACHTAFTKEMFLNASTIQWEVFNRPEIGDFIHLKGGFNKKWKVLEQSSNPALKSGFWNLGFKCLNPTDILIKQAPEMPASKEELIKRQAAAKRHSAV